MDSNDEDEVKSLSRVGTLTSTVFFLRVDHQDKIFYKFLKTLCTIAADILEDFWGSRG